MTGGPGERVVVLALGVCEVGPVVLLLLVVRFEPKAPKPLKREVMETTQ